MRTASCFMRSKLGHQRGVAGARFGVALEDCVHFGVGHARGGADDAFDDFEALDAAGGVELHDATEHEAVFVRAQAADVGRELLRQHGDGAIGEVDAGAAQAGFEIEGGVGSDVLGHVGDVDLQLVAAVGALGDENGVVEVAGGLAVDGDDGQPRKSAPAGSSLLVEMRDGARLGEHMLGKDPRQLVLADHHLHVDAEVVGRARGSRSRGRWADAWAWANW